MIVTEAVCECAIIAVLENTSVLYLWNILSLAIVPWLTFLASANLVPDTWYVIVWVPLWPKLPSMPAP
jgi:hypothetical protein